MHVVGLSHIRLSPQAEERLDFLAEQSGRTKAFYLRQMIESGLDAFSIFSMTAWPSKTTRALSVNP